MDKRQDARQPVRCGFWFITRSNVGRGIMLGKEILEEPSKLTITQSRARYQIDSSSDLLERSIPPFGRFTNEQSCALNRNWHSVLNRMGVVGQTSLKLSVLPKSL